MKKKNSTGFILTSFTHIVQVRDAPLKNLIHVSLNCLKAAHLSFLTFYRISNQSFNSEIMNAGGDCDSAAGLIKRCCLFNMNGPFQTSLTVHPVSLPDASSAIFLSLSRSRSRPLRECPSCSQLPNTSRAPPTTPPFCPPFFSSATFCCRSLSGADGKLQLWNYGAPILTGQQSTSESLLLINKDLRVKVTDPENIGRCFLLKHYEYIYIYIYLSGCCSACTNTQILYRR